MNFFDRYLQLCEANNLLPRSEKAAKMFGVTRATITSWDKNQSIPKGDTLIHIADAFGVSVDYLVGRTDDPVDYSNPDLQAELAGAAMDALGGDPKKALAFQQAVAQDAASDPGPRQTATPRILTLWNQLDLMDQVRVEAYIEGMLATDKYRIQQAKKMG